MKRTGRQTRTAPAKVTSRESDVMRKEAVVDPWRSLQLPPELRIGNLVVTATVRDFDDSCIPNVYPVSRFKPSVTVRFSEVNGTVLVFGSGSVLVAGGRSIEDIPLTLAGVQRYLRSVNGGKPVVLHNIHVQNIVCTGVLADEVDLRSYVSAHPDYVMLDENLFRGARVRHREAVLLFTTGKYVSVGSASARQALLSFRVFRHYAQNFVCNRSSTFGHVNLLRLQRIALFEFRVSSEFRQEGGRAVLFFGEQVPWTKELDAFARLMRHPCSHREAFNVNNCRLTERGFAWVHTPENEQALTRLCRYEHPDFHFADDKGGKTSAVTRNPTTTDGDFTVEDVIAEVLEGSAP
jgi:TATA-box binding protein (TBP) (component of TFIID and TFIIIB)